MNKVLIVTNTSRTEAESNLSKTGDWSPIVNDQTELVFFNSVAGLLSYTEHSSYNSPVLFMFFHGLEFVENTISSLIELTHPPGVPRDVPLEYSMYLSSSSSRRSSLANSTISMTTSHFADLRFYFDLSIVETNVYTTSVDFCSVATIASLVLSKSGVLSDNRSLYIDDTNIPGGKDQSMRCLFRSFPGLDLKLGSGVY